ncbi:hypothetical protein CCP2SC5_110033 [Azospirillaceae bacterium]
MRPGGVELVAKTETNAPFYMIMCFYEMHPRYKMHPRYELTFADKILVLQQSLGCSLQARTMVSFYRLLRSHNLLDERQPC